MLATDVLWSDPSANEGLGTNDTRGVGLLFGPDITKVGGCTRVIIVIIKGAGLRPCCCCVKLSPSNRLQ